MSKGTILNPDESAVEAVDDENIARWQKEFDELDDDHDSPGEPMDEEAAIQKRGYRSDLLYKVRSGSILKGGRTRSTIRYTCIHCNHVTERAPGIREHVYREHFKVPLDCTECSFTTFSWAGIDNHRRNTHNLKALQCPLCSYKSAVMFKMTKHMRKKHAGVVVDKFKAEKVRTDFMSKSKKPLESRTRTGSMAEHYEIVRDEEKKIRCYRCRVCLKEEKSNGKILIHINVEHIKKDLRCIWCDYTTLNDTTLQSHVKLKHEYRKKKCPQTGCHYSTIEKSKFDDHIIDHTKEKEVQRKTCQPVKKLRTCVWCEFCSATYLNFHNHVKHKHERARKPCILPSCKMTFICEEDFQDHLFKKHGAYYDDQDHSIKFRAAVPL